MISIISAALRSACSTAVRRLGTFVDKLALFLVVWTEKRWHTEAIHCAIAQKKVGNDVWIGYSGAYNAASAATPENRPPPPRIIPPADADEVMQEQLAWLIWHVNGVICGCSECQRYLKIRELLLVPMVG